MFLTYNKAKLVFHSGCRVDFFWDNGGWKVERFIIRVVYQYFSYSFYRSFVFET